LRELKADWVKTSTGYGSGGAIHADLILMRKHSPAHVQVKAAGGVRDLDALLAARALGVSRCGATRTAGILDEARRRLGFRRSKLGKRRRSLRGISAEFSAWCGERKGLGSRLTATGRMNYSLGAGRATAKAAASRRTPK